MTLESIRIVQIKSAASLISLDRERNFPSEEYFKDNDEGPNGVFAAVQGMELVGVARLSCSLANGEQNARFVLDKVQVDEKYLNGALRFELMKTCLSWASQQRLEGRIDLAVFPIG